MTFEKQIQRELKIFIRKFSSLSVLCTVKNYQVLFQNTAKKISVDFAPDQVMAYHLLHQPEKLFSYIKSKLGLNQTVFARKCSVGKIDNQTAAQFLDQFHLMNSTACAYSYGLIHSGKVVAVATFSKGRKMNRLPSDKRSFELIRFCTLPGITVTGGLTRILKYFCEEKKAGDIMTYVDKLLSDGASFVKAGFQIHSQTPPSAFIYDITSEKLHYKEKDREYDGELFITMHNSGNIKLVYTC